MSARLRQWRPSASPAGQRRTGAGTPAGHVHGQGFKILVSGFNGCLRRNHQTLPVCDVQVQVILRYTCVAQGLLHGIQGSRVTCTRPRVDSSGFRFQGLPAPQPAGPAGPGRTGAGTPAVHVRYPGFSVQFSGFKGFLHSNHQSSQYEAIIFEVHV